MSDPKRIVLVAALLAAHFEKKMETTDGMAMTVCRMGFSNARTTESTLSSPGAGNAWRWSVMANNSTARTASRKISNGKQFLNGSVGDSSGSGATFSSGTQNVPCDRFFRGLKSLRFHRTAEPGMQVRLLQWRINPRRKFSGWPPKFGSSGTPRDWEAKAWIVNWASRGNRRHCFRGISLALPGRRDHPDFALRQALHRARRRA